MIQPTKAEIGTVACQTAFGWVGVAWSEQGLMVVTLPQPSEMEARSRLPGRPSAGPQPATGLDVKALVDKLQRYFDGELVTFHEPLDETVGTDFQRRVWAATRAIPRGQTRTYGEITRQLGLPRAARAVGQANAHNPWAVVVPCHRVVGHDDHLTGFGGGLDMKRVLLVLEGAPVVDRRI